MSLGVTCDDIRSSLPNSGHDAQFLGDFIQRSVFRQSLQGVNDGLFVCHGSEVNALTEAWQDLACEPMRAFKPGALELRAVYELAASCPGGAGRRRGCQDQHGDLEQQ